MAQTVDFTFTPTIPFARNIRVADAKNVWPTIGNLEVRAQLRAGRTSTSTLIADLHEHMTWAFDGDDLVITWAMTGAQVAEVARGGYYDVVISDTGAIDTRAIRVLAGQIRPGTIVTAAEDAA